MAGCWAAREFVSFYNGHPDFSHLDFDLSCDRAVVVGNGNVALDVAQILTMPVSELEKTNIGDHAIAALHRSQIQEVVILGRRGSLQGSCNNPELEELEHLSGVDVIVQGEELPGERDEFLMGADWETVRKLKTLRRLVQREPKAGNKRIVLRFLASPVSLSGNGKVEQLRVMRNRLVLDVSENQNVQLTDEESILDIGLVLRAIGYRGTAFPGLPFDERRGVIKNAKGRVTGDEHALPGTYVTGRIKRGCRGIIGSNKKCSGETVRCLFEDILADRLPPADLDKDGVMAIIQDRKPDIVWRDGWFAIIHRELEAGRSQGRPRVKIIEKDKLLKCASGLPLDSEVGEQG